MSGTAKHESLLFHTKAKGLFGRPLFVKFLISKHVLGQIMCYNNE